MAIASNLIEHQVIIELQDLEIVLGEESTPGTDILSHIGQLGQVISKLRYERMIFHTIRRQVPAESPCHGDIRCVHLNPSSPGDILHHVKVLGTAHELIRLLVGPVVLIHAIEIGGTEVVEPVNQSEHIYLVL